MSNEYMDWKRDNLLSFTQYIVGRNEDNQFFNKLKEQNIIPQKRFSYNNNRYFITLNDKLYLILLDLTGVAIGYVKQEDILSFIEEEILYYTNKERLNGIYSE